MNAISVKALILLVLLSVLVGCAGSEPKMSSWLGVPQDEIVNQLGDPSQRPFRAGQSRMNSPQEYEQ